MQYSNLRFSVKDLSLAYNYASRLCGLEGVLQVRVIPEGEIDNKKFPDIIPEFWLLQVLLMDEAASEVERIIAMNMAVTDFSILPDGEKIMKETTQTRYYFNISYLPMVYSDEKIAALVAAVQAVEGVDESRALPCNPNGKGRHVMQALVEPKGLDKVKELLTLFFDTPVHHEVYIPMEQVIILDNCTGVN